MNTRCIIILLVSATLSTTAMAKGRSYRSSRGTALERARSTGLRFSQRTEKECEPGKCQDEDGLCTDAECQDGAGQCAGAECQDGARKCAVGDCLDDAGKCADGECQDGAGECKAGECQDSAGECAEGECSDPNGECIAGECQDDQDADGVPLFLRIRYAGSERFRRKR